MRLSEIVATLFVTGSMAFASQSTFQTELDKARALMAGHRFDEAVDAFKRANKLADNRSADCFAGLVEAYEKLGEHKNTMKAAESLLENARTPREFFYGYSAKAVALTSLAKGNEKKLREAAELLRLALEQEYQEPVARFNRGFVLLKIRDVDEGSNELRRFLDSGAEGLAADEARWFLEDPARAGEGMIPWFAATTLDGKDISAKTFLGKVILLDVWATWCPPCQEAIPDLKSLQAEFADTAFEVVSVSVDGKTEVWEDYIAEKEMAWTQVLDRGRVVPRFLGVGQIALPTYFVIDSGGRIRDVVVGDSRDTFIRLRRSISKCLKDAAGES